jgi:hypothetical protein
MPQQKIMDHQRAKRVRHNDKSIARLAVLGLLKSLRLDNVLHRPIHVL